MRCVFCGNDHYPQGEDTTGKDNEGVVTLRFDSGRTYIVPANLDHFIIAHEFKPPGSLVGDLMNSRYVAEGVVFAQGRPITIAVTEDYPLGTVPTAAPYRLREHIKAALKAKTEVVDQV